MQAHHEGLAHGRRKGIAQGPKTTTSDSDPDLGHRVPWKQDFRQTGPPLHLRMRWAAMPPGACAPGSGTKFRLCEDPPCVQVPRPQSKCACPDNPTGMRVRIEQCRTMEPERVQRELPKARTRLQQMLPLCHTCCCNSTSTNQALHPGLEPGRTPSR